MEIGRKAVDLLVLMLEANGTVVTTERIKEHLWAASQAASEGALRVYITQIKKIFPSAVKNMRGIGYLFDRTKVSS